MRNVQVDVLPRSLLIARRGLGGSAGGAQEETDPPAARAPKQELRVPGGGGMDLRLLPKSERLKMELELRGGAGLDGKVCVVRAHAHVCVCVFVSCALHTYRASYLRAIAVHVLGQLRSNVSYSS